MTEPKPTCFIAMPITTTEEVAKRYRDDEHWTHVMEQLFVPAIEAAGFAAVRPASIGSDMIHATIIKQLSEADLVLVDLSEHNPNVFFELGVRTSINKPVAVVRSVGTRIPFDTIGMNTPEYDPALRVWNMSEEIAALADHLRNAQATCAGENPMWRQFGLTLKAEEPTSNATPVEARLEILTEGLDQLRNDVLFLARKPRVSPPKRPSDDEVLVNERALAHNAILANAQQRGLDVEIHWATGHLVNVHVMNEASTATASKFADDLRVALAKTRWKPRVVIANSDAGQTKATVF